MVVLACFRAFLQCIFRINTCQRTNNNVCKSSQAELNLLQFDPGRIPFGQRGRHKSDLKTVLLMLIVLMNEVCCFNDVMLIF